MMRHSFFTVFLVLVITSSMAAASRKKTESVQTLRIEYGGKKFVLLDRHLRVIERAKVKTEVILSEPQARALRSAVVAQIWNLNYRLKQHRSTASKCRPALVLETPDTAEKSSVCFDERIKLSSSIPLLEGLNKLIK